jgi:hypothetical protein
VVMRFAGMKKDVRASTAWLLFEPKMVRKGRL